MARPLLALPLVLLASPALGQTPGAATPDPVRLEYTGAATCADAPTFRNLVASRMSGRDPFTSDAPKRLVITLRRGGPAWFSGAASMFDATGKRRDHRELDAPNCTELAESIAFVVSIWMAPLVLPAATPPEAAPLPPPQLRRRHPSPRSLRHPSHPSRPRCRRRPYRLSRSGRRSRPGSMRARGWSSELGCSRRSA
jgi:hypothetical protein